MIFINTHCVFHTLILDWICIFIYMYCTEYRISNTEYSTTVHMDIHRMYMDIHGYMWVYMDM